MSIIVVIIGIVFGSILTLVTLIFGILALSGGKTKNGLMWGLGFIFSMTFLIISIYTFVKRVGNRMKDEVAYSQQNMLSNGDSDNNGFYQEQRQNFLDTLQKYTRESVKVPTDFYSNESAKLNKDEYTTTLPFVYPLSFRYHVGSTLGDVISDISDSTFLKNVSIMAFDENFMIAKIDNKNDEEQLKSGHTETEYVLFDLRTREYLPFPNEIKLMETADKIGYAGSPQMNFLSDYYKGWIDNMGLDQ